ncbi:hypothetical protein WICPIJ_006229 [Wickerhamomyces pijperi]|uniref:Uncharacterized protein n=1 Tax=Wickerhamomyces pijperi TaxID=599730 RepID=A0A9P8Q419_WICPI|nr:hypothetical protein WICPIJ_006229 [Wickerhamomyces pijperi]
MLSLDSIEESLEHPEHNSEGSDVVLLQVQILLQLCDCVVSESDPGLLVLHSGLESLDEPPLIELGQHIVNQLDLVRKDIGVL